VISPPRTLLGLLRRDQGRWSWLLVLALVLGQAFASGRHAAMAAAPDIFASAICSGGEHAVPPSDQPGQPAEAPDCCLVFCQAASPALLPELLKLPPLRFVVAAAERAPAATAPASAAARAAHRPRGPPARG
jgi:hypothetical protein